ncbi:MAG: tetratricopeptide repeat protein [Desulfobacteraceae bacterium]|nr:tetratricopeptide repeat protein [Desulfobacteraceae bacterium]
MKNQLKTTLKRIAFLTWFPCLFLAVILEGCVGFGVKSSEGIEYGNPFYEHMKYLPKNQLVDRISEQDEELIWEEMNALELEQLGDNLLQKKKAADAYVKYEKLLAKDPGNTLIQVKMARALIIGGFYEDAWKLLKTLIEHKPDLARAWEVMGIVYFEKNDYVQAQSHFNKALSLDTSRWQVYNYQGQIHDIQKEYAMAAQAYEKAICLKPRKGFLYNNFGVSCALAGLHEQAVNAFKRAVRLNYTQVKVFNNMGTCLAALGRYHQAFEAFSSGVGEARAYNNIGCIYMLEGNYEAAIESFERAIAITPKFYTVAYTNLKKTRRAIR